MGRGLPRSIEAARTAKEERRATLLEMSIGENILPARRGIRSITLHSDGNHKFKYPQVQIGDVLVSSWPCRNSADKGSPMLKIASYSSVNVPTLRTHSLCGDRRVSDNI